MSPEELADLWLVVSTPLMVPAISRETLGELLAVYDAAAHLIDVLDGKKRYHRTNTAIPNLRRAVKAARPDGDDPGA